METLLSGLNPFQAIGVIVVIVIIALYVIVFPYIFFGAMVDEIKVWLSLRSADDNHTLPELLEPELPKKDTANRS